MAAVHHGPFDLVGTFPLCLILLEVLTQITYHGMSRPTVGKPSGKAFRERGYVCLAR
jgi:hypothetical protein